MAFMPSLVTECAVVISGEVEVIIEVSCPLPATRKVVVAIFYLRPSQRVGS